MVFPVLPVEQEQLNHFKMLVETLQIPSKERVVFVENLPSKYTERELRSFFNGGNTSTY